MDSVISSCKFYHIKLSYIVLLDYHCTATEDLQYVSIRLLIYRLTNDVRCNLVLRETTDLTGNAVYIQRELSSSLSLTIKESVRCVKRYCINIVMFYLLLVMLKRVFKLYFGAGKHQSNTPLGFV